MLGFKDSRVSLLSPAVAECAFLEEPWNCLLAINSKLNESLVALEDVSVREAASQGLQEKSGLARKRNSIQKEDCESDTCTRDAKQRGVEDNPPFTASWHFWLKECASLAAFQPGTMGTRTSWLSFLTR